MPIFYLDYVNGNDATTATPLGWWSRTYTNGSGTAPAADELATGSVSGSTARLTVVVAPTSGSWGAGTAAGTMYFYGRSAAFQAETLNFAGGASCSIAGDFTYCAWKTFQTGATAARTAPGDTIRVAKSADPTSMAQSAQWTTTTTVGGGMPATVNISSSTNASPIEITTAAVHGLATGDVVQVLAHTTNTSANGTWIVTYVSTTKFTLDGSAGVGVGGATGTIQKINSKAVVLTTAVTTAINDCEANWTPGAQTTSANTYTTTRKEGNSCVAIITAATCNANQIIAYYGLGSSINLSTKQQISFWIRNETTALAAGDLQVRLYSDAACTLLVETFNIPAVASTAAWVPFTINKGSAMSATVQGIAVYTTVQFNAKTVYIDNFIACGASTADDALSLQSLISKNSAAKGGNEPWLAIQSITGQGTVNSGRIILLDNINSTLSSAGRGYYGSTESVPLYKRETTKIATMLTTTTAYMNQPQEGGTLAGGNITYSGGWDSATNLQNGDTYFDGINGLGTCFRPDASTGSYLTFTNFSVCRFNRAFYNAGGNYSNITINWNNANNCIGAYYPEGGNGKNSSFTCINTCNCNTANIWLYQYETACIFTVTNCNSCIGPGISLRDSCSGNTFTITTCSNNGSVGVSISPAGEAMCINNKFYITNADYNSTYAIYYYQCTSNNCTYGCSMSNNGTACVYNTRGINYLKSCTLNGTEFAGALTNANTRVYSTDHDNSTDNHYIYTDGGVIQSDNSADRHTLSGICWKLSPTSTNRNIYYPLDLCIAKIACNANTQVTVKAWFKKTHATDIGARLICYANQLSGITSDKIATKTNDTNYEELSISFTPTEAGVVEICAEAYWAANTADESVFVDDMTVTQV